jgi:hypothetical protein
MVQWRNFSFWEFRLRAIRDGLKANLNAGKKPFREIAVYSENGILGNCTGAIQMLKRLRPRLKRCYSASRSATKVQPLDRAAPPLPSVRSNSEWQSELPPGPPQPARLALRLVSNGRPRCPVPLNVPNQTGNVFLQCRNLFSSFDLSFSCRPRPSPMNSEAAFATSALIRSLSSRRNGFAFRCKSTRQSITER